jgi:membrane protein implicated in regulation of membrane protease activity
LEHAYRFIALMMGGSAFILAIILWRAATVMGLTWRTLMYQEGALSLQLLYWMGLAFTSIIWVRPMFHHRKRSAIPQATEAETITIIQPGQMGRVLYEGCSWQACCENYTGTIAPHQKVYVLHREGNLLFIAPEDLFRA